MDIHTCSYYCDRPACIKAQRDELRGRLEGRVMDDKVREALDTADEYVALDISCRGEGKRNVKLRESLATIRAHIEGLEADAARYRWLRQFDVDSYLANGKLERLDAAIDSAMQENRDGR